MTDETTEPEADETPSGASSMASGKPLAEGGKESVAEEDPQTFPREYVVQLREEAAKHRTRAQGRDDLAQRLHTALVAATGRLADPTDLAFDEEHLADEDALSAAVDDLLARKPHLASRRVVGDVGQGATGSDSTVDLAGMLRRQAS